VLVDGGQRRALVECEGDVKGTWDLYFEAEALEENAVVSTRLVLDARQPKKRSLKEIMAAVSYLRQKNNGHLPDEIWRGAGAAAGAVFLGNMHTSQNSKILQEHKITHIVNCTSDLPNHFEPPRSSRGDASDGSAIAVTYLRFHQIDIFSATLAQVVGGANNWTWGQHPENAAAAGVSAFFEPFFQFVDDAVNAGGNVLIHCVAGAHRAGTSACAYVMHKDPTLTTAQAIAHCKARRPIVDPAISDRLIALLDELHAVHTGDTRRPPEEAAVADLIAAAPATIDLNAEGHKVLREVDAVAAGAQ